MCIVSCAPSRRGTEPGALSLIATVKKRLHWGVILCLGTPWHQRGGYSEYPKRFLKPCRDLLITLPGIVGRAANIFPLSFLYNLTQKKSATHGAHALDPPVITPRPQFYRDLLRIQVCRVSPGVGFRSVLEYQRFASLFGRGRDDIVWHRALLWRDDDVVSDVTVSLIGSCHQA